MESCGGRRTGGKKVSGNPLVVHQAFVAIAGATQSSERPALGGTAPISFLSGASASGDAPGPCPKEIRDRHDDEEKLSLCLDPILEKDKELHFEFVDRLLDSGIISFQGSAEGRDSNSSSS